MAILFKTIRWKNFLSTGNQFTEVYLNKSTTTLIVGENGTGKSTILDALCFSLFGKAFRNINKPQLCNSINNKECVVEIEFDIGSKSYKVIRGIKPSVFEIHCNGELVDQSSAAKDYQKYLEESILKVNFKSFTQIVILGSATFTPFMQLPAGHRREIIEDILDIKIFSQMNLLLKEKITNIKDLIKLTENKITLQKEKTRLQKEFIESLETDKKKKVSDTLELIETTEKEIEEHLSQIKNKETELSILKDKVKNHEKLVDGIKKYKQCENKLKTKSSSIEKDIEFYADHDDCPTCGQILAEELKTKKISESEKSKQELMEAIENIAKKLNSIQTELDVVETNNKKIEDVNSEITEINYRISASQKYISKLQKEIAVSTVESSNIKEEKTKLKEMAKEVIHLTEEKTKQNIEKQYLDVCGLLLKDTGIKTTVIKQYLPIINKLVNKYLTFMDFFVHFELDESFNESIKSRHRDDFSYSSFSEGEKQRINLALLFTWRTIAKLKNSVSTNLLILDEVLDGSLDGVGMDYVMNLLNEMSEDANVFVISHRGDQLFDKFRSVIKLEKKNNFSRIVV